MSKAEILAVEDKPQSESKKTGPPDWTKIHKAEAVEFVRKFYQTSFDWLKQAYHANWDKYERNYRNIYDPSIAAKKEDWQATMFIPVTVTNVEVISAALTKLASGKKRPIALEPREMGDELQAELNTDILDYLREKGDYELARYDAVKEACIFGSGFMKIFWEKKMGKRLVVNGNKKEWQEVLVKDCLRYQHIHIRNIFPEPNALDIQRYIHRDRLPYSELARMSERGLFDKDSVKELWLVKETDNFESDISTVKYEQGITDPKLERPTYDKKHTVWEFNGMVPLKWIKMDMPENTEEERMKAGETVCGRILVGSGHFFLASGENDSYDETPNLVKMDYLRNGQTYGIGVAQLICGLQEEINEIRNQRVDNVSLLMNKMIAVIEKYVVNPEEIRSKPGAIWRFKGTELDDIKKVFAEIQLTDVPISAFRETLEIERQIQETSAANRVTTGSAGLTKDANQTLGGMELLKQAAFDRFIVYAYLIGRMFDVNVAKKSSEQIYLNAGDDLIRAILGEVPIEVLPDQFLPRWQCWKRLPPEQLNVCYDFVPVDVFSMENRFQKGQDLASKAQLTATLLPGWGPKPVLEKIWKTADFTSDEIAEILASLPDGPIPTPMGMGQGVPSISKPTRQSTGERPPVPSPMGNGAMSGAPIG